MYSVANLKSKHSSLRSFRKWLQIICFFLFSLTSMTVIGQVNLTFTKGYIGTQDNNSIGVAKNITSFSTLGIARVSFTQINASSFGRSSGNDLDGIIKIYLAPGATSTQAINSVITLNASLNWREISTSIESFGFIFNAGQNATITKGGTPYQIIGGNTANFSSTFGLMVYNSSIILNNGDDRNVNPAISGLIDDFNAELLSTPQPANITLANTAVTEGQNLVFVTTLTNPTTVSPTAYTLTRAGTASSSGDYSTTYSFSNGVIDNRDGTINVPSGVSSFTITVRTIDDLAVENTETIILNIGNASATGEILDNEAHPTINTSGTLNSFVTCSGCILSPQSFRISGEYLSDNINVTAPNGFEVSLTSNGGYATSINMTPTAETLTNTTVFVRLTSSATSVASGVISITSSGAISKTITATTNTDNALNLDGINDVVTIPDNVALDLTTNYTLEAWIKPTAFTSYAGIVSKNYTSTINGYKLRLTGTGDYSGINFDGLSTSNGVLTINKWHHIAAVNTGGTRTLYINGVAQTLSGGTASPTVANSDPLFIGQDFVSGVGKFFNGSIDEVRIWSTARDANDIVSNMNVPLTGNETGLVANYTFNQGIANGTNTATTSILNNTTNSLSGNIFGVALTGSTSNFVEGFMPSISAAGNVTTLLKSATLSLTNTLSGGVWSSTNSNIATINAATGLVIGVEGGSVTITYTICNKIATYGLTVILAPTITSTKLNSFTYCSGCSITSKYITVSGANLTSNVNIAATNGFQLSNSENGVYSSTISLIPNTGTLSNTNIFVRLTNNTIAASNGTLTITSNGAVSKTVTVTSNSDNALNFDGANDMVTIADNDSLDLTTNYTIEAWVKPTSFSSFAGIVSKFHAAASNGYNLKLIGTDDYSGISFDGMSTSNEVLSLNNWYHIAGVNENGTRKIYINGVEQAITGTPLVTAVNTDPVIIGQDFSSLGSRFFKGSIDEVRIWKTARTANDIASNMNIMLTGNESDLVAHYNFDQGIANGTNTATTTLINNTTNTLAGTITGMTLTGTVSNFVDGFMPSITATDSLTEVLVGKTLTLSNILTSGVWSSTNTNIATVNSSTGIVTGVAAGDVSITYSICGKKVSYKLNVTVITATGTFTTFTGCFGIPSVAQPLVVNAVTLTNNLVVTAPVGYEVATTRGGTYSSSISLTPISGTISNTTIYVRLSSKAFNGDHGDLIFSSANVKSKIVPITIASVKLIKKVKVKISSNVSDNKSCLGNNVVFTAKAENAGLTPTYQWKLNGANVGTNSATYSNTSLINSDSVSVMLTSENTFCEGPITSNSISISIVSAPVTPTTITGINSLCSGSNAAYTVSGVATAESYDWIVSGNMSATSSYSNVLNTLGSNEAGLAAIKVRAKNFCGISDYSAEYNVTITNTPGPKANFNINNNNICLGTEAIYFTDTSMMNPTTNYPIINYEWSFGDGSATDISQNSSRNYITSGSHNVILKIETQDNCFASITKPAIVDPLSIAGTIFTEDSILCSGDTSLLNLFGQEGAIQWFSSPIGGLDEWTMINGANGTELNTGKLTKSTKYKVEVKSGSCSTVTSESFTVTVKHAPTMKVLAPDDVSDTVKYFKLKYELLYDDALNNWKPNAYNLIVSKGNPQPNFNPDNNYRLTDSILKITLPRNVIKGKYDFRISAVELPKTCSESESLTFSLWVGTPEFSYKTPDTILKLGKRIDPLVIKSNIAQFTNKPTFKISPSLPAGLTIDSTTGIISGIPTSVSTKTSYVVSGEIFSRTITTTIAITVIEDKPEGLAYKTPNVFVLGTAIISLTPTSTSGFIRSYSINKTLPVGLTFNSTTGVITGTPTAISSKTSYEVTGTNTAGSVTSTIVITVATTPAVPIVRNARFIFGNPGLPSYLNAFVNPLPTGIIPVWCTDGTQNCTQEPQPTPTIIGKYIYQIRAYDTTNKLYSTSFVNDTLIIAPVSPDVIDSSYLLGIKKNPTDVSVQVSGMDGAKFNYYYLGALQNGIPAIGSIFGTKKYAVSQIFNNVESDTVNFNVTLYDPANMIHLQNIIDSGILQSNLTYNFPFTLILTNLTNLTFTNIILSNNLQSSVPISSEFTIVKNTAAGGLKVNSSFNGNSNINLTLASSTLAPFAKDTSRFIMNIRPKGFSGNLENIAYVKADTKWGTITIQSSSTTKVNEKTKSSTKYKVKELKISIPEGFSPNNDGINDYFIIVKPFNTTIDLEVYNRSGNIVYSKKNYNNDWNGKGNKNYSERDLDDNGYYYSIRAVDEDGKAQVFKGFVIIQR